MNDRMQLAIQATRAGKIRSAQRLLIEELNESPENAHAWYLLSLIDSSREHKLAFLNKVLELDPDHSRAKAKLEELTKAQPDPSAFLDELEEEAEAGVEASVEHTDEALKPAGIVDDTIDKTESTGEEFAEPVVAMEPLAVEEKPASGVEVQVIKSESLVPEREPRVERSDSLKPDSGKDKVLTYVLVVLAVIALILLAALLYLLLSP